MTDQAPLRARPTIYNGIPMRSRFEARVAAWLDSLGVGWVHEPVAFASSDGQYLPDFELTGSYFPQHIRWRTFLEVKGAFDAQTYFSTMARMDVILASDPNAVLMMADDEMLSMGRVACRNVRSRDWEERYFVEAMVYRGFIPMPIAWGLPAWDAS